MAGSQQKSRRVTKNSRHRRAQVFGRHLNYRARQTLADQDRNYHQGSRHRLRISRTILYTLIRHTDLEALIERKLVG